MSPLLLLWLLKKQGQIDFSFVFFVYHTSLSAAEIFGIIYTPPVCLSVSHSMCYLFFQLCLGSIDYDYVYVILVCYLSTYLSIRFFWQSQSFLKYLFLLTITIICCFFNNKDLKVQCSLNFFLPNPVIVSVF